MATFTRNVNYYNYKLSRFKTTKKWAKVTPVYGNQLHHILGLRHVSYILEGILDFDGHLVLAHKSLTHSIELINPPTSRST